MSKVADFTESELDLIHQTLKERFEKEIEVQPANVQTHPGPGLHPNQSGN